VCSVNIYKAREEIKHTRITDMKLRATYYARVSNESDEQLNSLENQKEYYENYIKNNPDREFVKGYIVESLSGLSTKKRKAQKLSVILLIYTT